MGLENYLSRKTYCVQLDASDKVKFEAGLGVDLGCSMVIQLKDDRKVVDG